MINAPDAVLAAREELRNHGYFVGWADELTELPGIVTSFRDSHFDRLQLDPRAYGKLHARDVIRWNQARPLFPGETYVPFYAFEAETIAFCDQDGNVADDFSRMRVVASPCSQLMVSTSLQMIPPEQRTPHGVMSADYFAYSSGVSCEPHKDGFGDYVFIWAINRSADAAGCVNVLHPDAGGQDKHIELSPGMVLAFDDRRFQHSVTELTCGTREAVIFINCLGGSWGPVAQAAI